MVRVQDRPPYPNMLNSRPAPATIGGHEISNFAHRGSADLGGAAVCGLSRGHAEVVEAAFRDGPDGAARHRPAGHGRRPSALLYHPADKTPVAFVRAAGGP